MISFLSSPQLTLKGTIRVYLSKESCSTSALKRTYICDTGGHWRGLIDMREMDKLVEAQAELLTSRCHGMGNAVHRGCIEVDIKSWHRS